jgi:hypothetical protein
MVSRLEVPAAIKKYCGQLVKRFCCVQCCFVQVTETTCQQAFDVASQQTQHINL